MPKYLVTSGSHFEPFSYEELVKPVAHMQQAQDLAQQAYDDLELDSAALDRYIKNDDGDAEARKMYDSYMDKLTKLQDDLYNYGFTSRTKRNLSDARKAYASDITRLAQAVKNRQDRSAEYWNFRKNNPDLVMGYDPGLSGLDEYLKDDTYGRNYYQYNGAQLAKDVAADAIAHARELMSVPTYRQNPNAPGYLIKTETQGFSNDEINRATQAILDGIENDDGTYNYDGLSDRERILADILSTHLSSTNARGQIDNDEYRRLINYGKQGLMQAAIEPKFSDMTDKQWDMNKSIELENLRHQHDKDLVDYKAQNPPSGSGSGSGAKKSGPMATVRVSKDYMTQGYKDLSKFYDRQNRKYDDDKKYTIFTPDGKSTVVDSNYAMTDLVYNPQERRDARLQYGGLDIAMPSSYLKELGAVTISDGRGGEVKIIAKPLSKDDAAKFGDKSWSGDDDLVGIYYNGKNGLTLYSALTDDFNQKRHDYNDRINKITGDEQNKKQISNWKKYALTPEEEMKLRKEHKDISPLVDTSDLRDILFTQERLGVGSDAVLYDGTDDMKKVLDNLANAWDSKYNSGVSHLGGKVTKDSKYAIHKVADGRLGYSSKRGDIITDIDKVFKDGDIKKNLTNISFMPEDIALGAEEGGRPMFRFTSAGTKGEFMADAEMLGNVVENKLYQPVVFDEEGNPVMDFCTAVDFMMTPLLRPSEVMTWNPIENKIWNTITSELLNGSEFDKASATGYLAGPLKSIDGKLEEMSPADIVRTKADQEKLYRDIADFINDHMTGIRNNILGE